MCFSASAIRADIRLDFPLELTEGEAVASFANTGVPHAVRFMDEIDSIDVPAAGREMRYHEAFGQAGANANFVRVEDEQTLRTRTYERGVEDERWRAERELSPRR